MNNKVMVRVLLAAAIALVGTFGWAGVASAQDNFNNCRSEGATPGEDTTQDNSTRCANEGDADGEVDQEGTASSGDGVAGQVAGVVSAGDASVDATNRSDDVEVDTGDATGTNTATLDTRAGIGFQADDEDVFNNCRSEGATPGDGSSQDNTDFCINAGDAEGAIGQAADAASGDGVGGQVIGVVTSAGGSADLVLDNESSDAEVSSGEGDFSNTSDAFVDSGVFFDVAP